MDSLVFETELESLNYIANQLVDINSLLQVFSQSLIVILGLLGFLLGVSFFRMVIKR